jgi:hypothetical protein
LACQSDENWFFGATAPKNNFQRRVGEGFTGAKQREMPDQVGHDVKGAGHDKGAPV